MIQVLTTGGTIEGLDYDLEKTEKQENQVSIEDFFLSANVSFPYKIEKTFSKDSRSITDKDRQFLAERIKASSASKIIVTHGTFTMEDTATYLERLRLDKAIILVGAFVLGTKKNTDAQFNLGYAIGSVQFLKSGVYVAMNGNLFKWDNVRKNIVTNKFERKDG